MVCAVATLMATMFGSAQAGPISIAMVTVGDPGNPADTQIMSDGTTGYGAVDYVYQIGKYDVTTAQYASFLNAVAATDLYHLYDISMPHDFPNNPSTVGISRTGNSGSHSYTVIGNGNAPVFDVTWGNAARFSNWLQNGQPTGSEGAGTTETGTYTLNGATSTAALMAVTRNPGATWVLPAENEWYKAAYYRGGGLNAGYWLYATQNNGMPSYLLSATGTNNMNFYNNGYTDPTNYLTSVGAFAASPGPYGTFDQGGNVFQWNETAVTGVGRGLRGGSYFDTLFSNELNSSFRFFGDPTVQRSNDFGFRVASVPEPFSITLVVVGAIGLLIWRRR